MTRDEALQLLAQYGYHVRMTTARTPAQQTIEGMVDRFPNDGGAEKANRWVGFAQGVLFAEGTFTLDELKEHSRRRSID